MTALSQLQATTTSKALSSLVPEPVLLEIERPVFAVYERSTQISGKTYAPGVWYHGQSNNSDSSSSPVDIWICSPLYVTAITSNDNSNFGRILRFRNTLGTWREWSMPMHMLKGRGEDLRGELLSLGVTLDTKHWSLMDKYLQSQRPEKVVISATGIGWHSDALFILARESIGRGDAIFQSEDASLDDFGKEGELKEWYNSIGEMCRGNPLLQLAIGSALAGPLLRWVNQSGGGFHIVGDSSTGKSTLIMAAASVWGHGDRYKRTWCATNNGLEGLAAQRSDTLLALDEIGESNPHEIGNIIYALANGTGKSRANRHGAARAARSWRVMLLSSGGVGLETLLAESGKSSRTGQELRLLEISSRRAHGCWDTVHHFPSGRHLSDSISTTSTSHYGHVGPKFVEQLIRMNVIPDLARRHGEVREKFKCQNGQEGRAADRFALVALALELASEWGLLPLDRMDGTNSILALFNDWTDERGSGNREDIKILGSIAEFVSRFGESHFSSRAGHSTTTILIKDRAGWWDNFGGEKLWCFTPYGLRLATKGFEFKRVTAALRSANWIAAHDPGKSSKNMNVDGHSKRLYCLRIQDL